MFKDVGPYAMEAGLSVQGALTTSAFGVQETKRRLQVDKKPCAKNRSSRQLHAVVARRTSPSRRFIGGSAASSRGASFPHSAMP